MVGKDRGLFLREVERACMNDKSTWMQHEHNDSPDHAWGSLVKCVQEVAYKYYAQRTSDDVTVQEGREQQRELLTRRASLKEQLGNTE
eukprot:68019-Pyramimonas_sp.AAC.1